MPPKNSTWAFARPAKRTPKVRLGPNSTQKGVFPFLPTQGRYRAMARVNNGWFWQRKEFVFDPTDEQFMTSPGKVGSANSIPKQNIAAQEDRWFSIQEKHDMAGTVPRNIKDRKGHSRRLQGITLFEEQVGGWTHQGKSKPLTQVQTGIAKHRRIKNPNAKFGLGKGLLDRAVSGDVVSMTVGVEDVGDLQTAVPADFQKRFVIEPRVNHNCLILPIFPQEVGVLLKNGGDNHLNFD